MLVVELGYFFIFTPFFMILTHYLSFWKHSRENVTHAYVRRFDTETKKVPSFQKFSMLLFDRFSISVRNFRSCINSVKKLFDFKGQLLYTGSYRNKYLSKTQNT